VVAFVIGSSDIDHKIKIKPIKLGGVKGLKSLVEEEDNIGPAPQQSLADARY
jgi:hypothetical protein